MPGNAATWRSFLPTGSRRSQEILKAPLTRTGLLTILRQSISVRGFLLPQALFQKSGDVFSFLALCRKVNIYMLTDVSTGIALNESNSK